MKADWSADRPAPAPKEQDLQLLRDLLAVTKALAARWEEKEDLEACQKLLDQRQAIIDRMARSSDLSNLAEWPASLRGEAQTYAAKLKELQEGTLEAWQEWARAKAQELARVRGNRQQLRRHLQGQGPSQPLYLDSEV